MQIKSILAVATLAASTLANPTWGNVQGKDKVPGYPWGIPGCLNDQQVQFIVKTFKSILTNPDRKAAGATSLQLLDVNYVETSDSINTLAGYPIGGASFKGRAQFITEVTAAPAIPVMNDIDILHDCTKVVWQWNVPQLGMSISPIKGFNKFVVDPSTGIVTANDLEFNSIAWGRDIGWTCTAPPSS